MERVKGVVKNDPTPRYMYLVVNVSVAVLIKMYVIQSLGSDLSPYSVSSKQ